MLFLGRGGGEAQGGGLQGLSSFCVRLEQRTDLSMTWFELVWS